MGSKLILTDCCDKTLQVKWTRIIFKFTFKIFVQTSNSQPKIFLSFGLNNISVRA